MDTEAIKNLFYEARSLPQVEQDGFILSRCGDDPAVVRRIRSLLAADERASRRLRSVGTHRGVTSVPRVIAGRRVVRLLGEGGFGLVYLAKESAPIERLVAIKVLRPGHEDGSVLARFENERKTLARMNHPGIAHVFEAGTTEDGRPYIAMEFVDGVAITDYCHERGLSVRACVRLIERACVAVHHAHQRGVIHRDIKPSNVLISEIEGEAHPKVIDFGIAKAVEDGCDDAGDLTKTMVGLGTLRYMAPEQAPGGGSADTRSDVFGLGAVLFACVSGKHPFDTDRFLARPSTPRLRQVTTLSRKGAGTSALTRLGPGLLIDLDRITSKAMAEDPDRRYVSAHAMAADLRRWLDGKPIEAGPDGVTYRMRKLISRHPSASAGAAVAALALLGASVASTVYATRADAARAEADRRQRETQRELEKYETMTDFTRRMLQAIDPSVARGQDTALLRGVLANALLELDENPPADGEVRGTLRSMIARVYFSIGEVRRAIELAETALDEVSEEAGPGSASAYAVTSGLAVIYADTGRLELARTALRRVLEFEIAQHGPEAPETLGTRANLAGIDHHLGNLDEAVRGFTAVHKAYAELYGDNDERTAKQLANLAMSLDGSGDREKAIEFLERAVAVHEAAGDADTLDSLAARGNLALVLNRAGQNERSLEQYKILLEREDELLPRNHPSAVVTRLNMGGLLWSMGDLPAAIEVLSEAVDRGRVSLPEDDHRLLYAIASLGIVLRDAERPDEGVGMLEESTRGIRGLSGNMHPMTLEIEAEYAHTLAAVGDHEAAATLVADLLGRARSALTAHPAVFFQVLESATHVRVLAGDTEGEIELLRQRYDLSATLHGENAPPTLAVAADIASAYQRLGDTDSAAQWLSLGGAGDPGER